MADKTVAKIDWPFNVQQTRRILVAVEARIEFLDEHPIEIDGNWSERRLARQTERAKERDDETAALLAFTESALNAAHENEVPDGQ